MALPSTSDAHADPSLDETARKQFEAARRAGRPEPLEQFLPPDDHPHYLGTLEELVHTDRVPQQRFDRMLWQAVHGTGSAPPPPGPNATGSRAGDG